MNSLHARLSPRLRG